MNWNLECDGPIALLRFHRPPTNMMSFRAIRELHDALLEIAGRADIAVVILASATPDYFVAHADLDDIARLVDGAPPDGDPEDWPRTFSLIESMPQPVVAAIDGQAWGGGCELALACAFRLASPVAHLAQMEICYGGMPGAGATQRLPRLVGASRAARMIMTGEPVDATTASRIGLVDEVLPHEGFLDHVRTWAEPIANKPADAVFAVKRAVFDGIRGSLQEGLQLERTLFHSLAQKAAGPNDASS